MKNNNYKNFDVSIEYLSPGKGSNIPVGNSYLYIETEPEIIKYRVKSSVIDVELKSKALVSERQMIEQMINELQMLLSYTTT